MKPKFKTGDYVEVSGTITGRGDLIGRIVSITTNEIYCKKEPYYEVRTFAFTEKIYCAERFLKEAKA